jgi:leucyl-tRNA synthetase
VERTGTVAYQAWPTWDEALCQEDTVEIAVQVNGRVRGRVVLPYTASAEAARRAALGADGVAPHVAGRTVSKFVYVPGKIINVVVG